MQKIFIIGLLLFIVAGGVYYLSKQTNIKPSPKACTMEAKICPDGSGVGRTGPNCEFAQCPAEKIDQTTNWKIYSGDSFSLRYPTQWNLYTMGSASGTGFILEITPTDEIDSQGEWFYLSRADYEDDPSLIDSTFKKRTGKTLLEHNLQPITVNNTEGFKGNNIFNAQISNDQKVDNILVRKGNILFEIAITKKINSQNEEIFNGIVSSIRFYSK